MKTVVLVLLVSGVLSGYAPGVFSDVVVNQMRYGHIDYIPDSISGYLAVEDCTLVGEIVWACFGDGRCSTYLIGDCAVRDDSDGTRTWMRTNNIAAEADYRTFTEHKSAGDVTFVTIFLIRYGYTFE